MNKLGKILVSVGAAMVTMLVTAAAYAQEAAGPTAFNDRDKIIGLAAGLGIGIAAFGGALGQGRAAAAALDGIARNPGASDKIFTPMILGLALIESLVIYSLIISILLLNKIH
ncbi:MAG: H+transporting two-sector ATPase subunit [Myxococcales bacterium]|nr:H+transporting two-sector ATPase subunit [Myxococcales bacterium]